MTLRETIERLEELAKIHGDELSVVLDSGDFVEPTVCFGYQKEVGFYRHDNANGVVYDIMPAIVIN